MQDIAAEAGISLKTLYASFAGKNEINREIHEVRGGDLVARITAELEQGGSPLERLHRKLPRDLLPR